MADRCDCRLTVLGNSTSLQQFQSSNWEKQLGVCYLEPLEFSRRRFVVLFEMQPLDELRFQRLSHRWATLVFLLDYEIPHRRRKGILKAMRGDVEQHEVRY